MKYDRMIAPEQFKANWKEIKNVLVCCSELKKRVHILVEPEKKIRTTGEGSQNRHLNGHIQQISQSTGQPFADVKKYIKQQAISMGYPMETRFGKPVMDIWGNPVGISEADSTTAECALLIEQAHMLAAELGIVLQENDNDWNY